MGLAGERHAATVEHQSPRAAVMILPGTTESVRGWKAASGSVFMIVVAVKSWSEMLSEQQKAKLLEAGRARLSSAREPRRLRGVIGSAQDS